MSLYVLLPQTCLTTLLQRDRWWPKSHPGQRPTSPAAPSIRLSQPTPSHLKPCPNPSSPSSLLPPCPSRPQTSTSSSTSSPPSPHRRTPNRSPTPHRPSRGLRGLLRTSPSPSCRRHHHRRRPNLRASRRLCFSPSPTYWSPEKT